MTDSGDVMELTCPHPQCGATHCYLRQRQPELRSVAICFTCEEPSILDIDSGCLRLPTPAEHAMIETSTSTIRSRERTQEIKQRIEMADWMLETEERVLKGEDVGGPA